MGLRIVKWTKPLTYPKQSFCPWQEEEEEGGEEEAEEEPPEEIVQEKKRKKPISISLKGGNVCKVSIAHKTSCIYYSLSRSNSGVSLIQWCLPRKGWGQ